MQQAFGTVIIVVVILGAIFAVASAIGMSGLYEQIGRGMFSLDKGSGAEPRSEAEAAQVRDDEIRQLLEARNAVRVGRGKAPLDVDAEIQALSPPERKVDPDLYEEVRVLVEMRNRRRVRKGEPPLDVEAEIERQLRDVMQPPGS